MKDLKNFEGLYAATEEGQIWSYKSKKYLKGTICGSGYLTVKLNKKTYYVHRLIAETFLDNPDNLPVVNHKDENKLNNRLENLEYCSYSGNRTHGTLSERLAQKSRKKVYCVELDKTFNSVNDAAAFISRTQSGISDCLCGRQKTCGGYHWEYSNSK